MPSEKDREWAEFLETVRAAKLAPYADALRALCVPSLRLKPAKSSPLRSRLGGLPTAPAGFAWPMSAGALGKAAPMDFVALLDLSEMRLPDFPAASVLPPAGTLAFFHGYQPGIDAQHCGSAGRVFFFAPGSDLAEVPAVADANVLPVIGLELEVLTEQLPPAESPFYALLLGDKLRKSNDLYGDAAQRFERVIEDYGQAGLRDAEDRPLHRLLGYADPLQSDPYVNTEGNAERAPLSAWHTLSSFERAASWRLLLQLDSDPDNGVFYGDGGVLAFMIRENYLAAGRFERAWVEWQSH